MGLNLLLPPRAEQYNKQLLATASDTLDNRYQTLGRRDSGRPAGWVHRSCAAHDNLSNQGRTNENQSHQQEFIDYPVPQRDRLTIMVKTIIVSQYSGSGAPGPGAPRSIASGPLYPASTVLNLLLTAEIRTVTKKCSEDVQNLFPHDDDGLKNLLVSAVSTGRYIASEWCSLGNGNSWAACDSYNVNRSEWNEYANKDLQYCYYIKFCIGKLGSVIMMISCHTSTL